ncbi:MAG: TonB-dependent receptor [Gemmatimonadetes bacterium]|nr:TonB-dependent receptor [Gemmatimonadota bacterium]
MIQGGPGVVLKGDCALWSFAALFAMAGAAAAQQSDTAKTQDTVAVPLPPIEVTASIAPTAGPVIGSGIPARISIIGRRQIEAWEPRTLADALATQAGISFYDDLGSPYKINLSIRGFNVGPVVGLPPGVSVFLDGVRQNEPDAAHVNFDLLPLEHVERIEFLGGTGSLLGSNSLGGAVNLITRRGGGEPGAEPEAELEVSGGSFGTASAEGSIAGLYRGWDTYAAGGYERSDGWRRVTGAQNYNGFLNLGRRLARSGIRFQAFGTKSKAETAGSLPESVFRTAPRTNFTAGDFEDLDVLQVALSGYAPLGPGRGSFTVYYRRHDAERFNVNQRPDPDVRGFSRNRTFGGNLDWRWTKARSNGELSLRAGIDGAAHSVRIRLFEEGEGEARDLTTDAESPSWDLAGYALADLLVGRLTVSGGFRYDVIRVPLEDQLDPASDTAHTFRRLSPRGGLSVQVGRAASIYSSVGQSFRAPVILELACADPEAACPLPFALGEDPPLDPVVATTYEVGARWTVGPALLNAAVYRTDVEDDIGFLASEEALFEGFFANIGRTRREGVEFGAEIPLAGGHMLYANYAYTRATYRTGAEIFSVRSDEEFRQSPWFGANDVETGSRLPLVPDHQVRAGALAALLGDLDVGIDARYTGRQWLRGDEANETRPLDGYVTADARLQWTGLGWGLSAVVTNLFDSAKAVFGTFNENRVTGELERFLTPLQARAFKLILRRSFGGGSG